MGVPLIIFIPLPFRRSISFPFILSVRRPKVTELESRYAPWIGNILLQKEPNLMHVLHARKADVSRQAHQEKIKMNS